MKYITDSNIKKIIFSIFDFCLRFIPKKKQEFPVNIKNILMVKPDHLGDMLMLTTIFPLIAEKYPNANIDIVCGEWGMAILENNPYIRNKIIINGYVTNRKNISYLKKIIEFIKTLKTALPKLNSTTYDLTLYMRSGKGNMIPLHWLMKPTFSIGYGVRTRGNLLNVDVSWTNGPHEVDTFLEICKNISININNKNKIKYELYPLESDYGVIEQIMKRYELLKKEFIIIHMGTGDKNRLLEATNWQNIINENKEISIVFTGLKSEEYLLDYLNLLNSQIVNLFGELSIFQLSIIMNYASRIYTVESLAAHLASMTDTPTISYYKYDPIWWGPYNAENVDIKLI